MTGTLTPTGAVRRLLAALLGGWLLAVQGVGIAQTVPKEYQIKAAFLYNFAKFVEWPEQSFADPGSPFVIGVLGRNPFGTVLGELASDRKINGREVRVEMLENLEAAASAQIVFIAAAEEAQLAKLLSAIGDRAVLTVGESETFTAQGGVIGFVLESDKVRFKINLGPAERGNLRISGQLQQLAKKVERLP